MVFTGVLADKRARRRERIILADKANGIGISLLRDKGDVSGNVDMSRAALYAGHAFKIGGAAAVLYMRNIVIFERREVVEDEFRRLKTDGAVGGIVNCKSSVLYKLKVALASLSLKDFIHKRSKLMKSHPARNAFSAALRKAELYECAGKLHRAVSYWRSRHSAFHIGINSLEGELRFIKGFYFKSVQCNFSP